MQQMPSSHARLASSPEAYRPSPAILRRVQGLRRHRGKIAAIDPRSGDYFIAEGTMEALRLARAEYRASIFYIVRVGQKAAHVLRSPNRRMGQVKRRSGAG
jgi:hypothetical protein